MPKFQILLMVVLISCVAFISCERVQNVVSPVMPDEDTTEPEETMNPDETMDMTDMSDPAMTGPSVVINELMADNDNTITDPQGGL